MALNPKPEKVRLLVVSILVLVLVVVVEPKPVEHPAVSEQWKEWLDWDQCAPDSDGLAGDSFSVAAAEAAHHQAITADHHPQSIGPPAGRPSGHNPPQSDYDASHLATEQKHSAYNSHKHGLGMLVDRNGLFGPGFWNARSIDDLLKGLGDGSAPGPDGHTLPEALQSSSGAQPVWEYSPAIAPTAPASRAVVVVPEPPITPSSGTNSNSVSKPRTPKRIDGLGPVVKSLKNKTRNPPSIKKTPPLCTHVGWYTLSLSPPTPQSPRLTSSSHSDPGPILPTTPRNPSEESVKLVPLQDALVFEITLFAPIPPSDPVQKKEIDRIQTKLKHRPGAILLIDPSEFLPTHHEYLDRAKLFADNIDDLKQKKRAHLSGKVRRHRLMTVVFQFDRSVELWHQRWLEKTGINLAQDLSLPMFTDYNCIRIVLPLYLFYVEMISSIVPRQKAEHGRINLTTELQMARRIFKTLAIASNHPGSCNNQSLKKAAETLKKQKNTRGITKITPLLWTHLEFWMQTCRPGVFKLSNSTKALPWTVKELFNNIFCYSYSALHNRYLLKDAMPSR
ncbi:uncharacterized protein PGTG_03510 [Puccinia graminis f. sp. tritici CRL 75-36-700-3]|uniref:Uncharacterized protein n=1 Tax=Puccinia graminis f. sp. tritici (strain CRL 75-36-700-3 / race SCCL) TaxID=418459 RepID=E3JZS9_PUCGT|nr:uncharacterized protein PGTG_03510 [Puccinia graminis f. sp. tritici CRL 75-36-700-3]EFP77554.2 hypothetical protein PGTG_03510 [Puccinia graminis f. sp. tritici CRL 75-36-700-3]